MLVFPHVDPPVDFDTALDTIRGAELQRHGRKGGLKMSENQYDAPAMEVVEFGKEDIVCITSGLDIDQNENGGSC